MRRFPSSPGDRAVLVALGSIGIMAVLWGLLMYAPVDFYSLVNATAGLGAVITVLLVIYTGNFILNLWDTHADRRHAVIGVLSLVLAAVVVALMGFTVLFAYL